MSRSVRIPRERWAARRMQLHRWLRQFDEPFKAGQPICELLVDGEVRTQLYDAPLDEDEELFVVGHYLQQGDEVEPSGYLLEYSENRFMYPRVLPRPSTYRFRDRYPSVFLSYRRADSEVYAGRLHESLVRTYGADEVFMDQFGIRPGEPYPWAIQQAAANCKAMVAVIGPSWAAEGDALQKLQREDDFLHRELVAAIDRRIPLIPVLVNGASVPQHFRLPDDLRPLPYLQMLDLTSRHWAADVMALTAEIDRAVRPQE
jgi:hypothetical protein